MDKKENIYFYTLFILSLTFLLFLFPFFAFSEFLEDVYILFIAFFISLFSIRILYILRFGKDYVFPYSFSNLKKWLKREKKDYVQKNKKVF